MLKIFAEQKINITTLNKLGFVDFSSFFDLKLSAFPILLIIFEILLGSKPPDLQINNVELCCSWGHQWTETICGILSTWNCAFVHILIDPKFKILFVLISPESESFPKIFILFGIDNEVEFAPIATFTRVVSNFGLSFEEESFEISLEGVHVQNWTTLIWPEFINYFFSLYFFYVGD